MLITKDEFVQWLDTPVTNEVFGIIKERLQDATAVLVKNAGLDSRDDGFYCGMIHAFNEILNISYDEGEHNVS